MRLLKLFALLAMLAAAGAVAAQADSDRRGRDSPWDSDPTFEFEVALRPAVAGSAGSGILRFRQPVDAQKRVYLDVWVRGLAPNRRYYLERATDTSVDDACTATNWLTLGQGNDPAAITPIATNETGTGRAALFRDLDTLPVGMEFDIQFRVIDAETGTTVLKSFCHQYTLRQ